MNYRLLSKYLGIFLAALALPLAVSALWAVWFAEWGALEAFLRTIAVTVAAGLSLWGVGHRAASRVYEREGLALVGLGWIFVAGTSCLPYVFSGTMDLSSAYFEAMSGYTTTGASVLEKIEPVAKSLLFWRATTHWLGGMGIIVLIIAVLPFLGAGGKQLYRSEVPGVDKTGLLPRIQDTAAMLYKIYVGMTVVQTACLVAAGLMQRLITQMYFPGEEYNDIDPILNGVEDLRARASLIARRMPDEPEGTQVYQFDIVLRGSQETPFFVEGK